MLSCQEFEIYDHTNSETILDNTSSAMRNSWSTYAQLNPRKCQKVDIVASIARLRQNQEIELHLNREETRIELDGYPHSFNICMFCGVRFPTQEDSCNAGKICSWTGGHVE